MRQEIKSWLFLIVLGIALLVGWWLGRDTPERIIAELADPRALADLKERGANPRVNKIVYWLYEATAEGDNPTNILKSALIRNYASPQECDLVFTAMIRNYVIAQRLGLLTEDHGNLDSLFSGRSPTITTGPYAGTKTEVDHIVPRSLAPEADNCLANLEIMPAELNRKKSNKVNSRHVSHAEKLYAVGWLEESSLNKVKAKADSGTAPTDFPDQDSSPK